MTITTMTSREFNQDASGAKRAAESGPVYITDRGQLSHVLLRAEAYEALVGAQNNIADLLALPGVEDIVIETPARRTRHKPADLR
jgi:PHD/YefM family antitoxin component YafN of YafNO toxin-antitoxin module